MKRAIIPISIEDKNCKISSYSELEELCKNDKQLYIALYLSGDVQRMSFSYSLDAPCNRIKEIPYLPNDKDPLSENGKISLLALKYHSSLMEISNTLEVTGIHRHKSMIISTAKEIVITGQLSLKYLLLRDMNFVVKGGAKLRLSSSMLDRVRITAEEGSLIELIDVEFSNIDTECVYLQKGATVSFYEDVRFFDVRGRFKIEHATFQTTGKLLDFADTGSILNFIETSEVHSIELIGDFIHLGKEIHLKQPITFHNASDSTIEVKTKKIITSNDICFDGDFIVFSNIFIEESSNTKVALSDFKGNLEIYSCDNLEFNNTKIEKSSSDCILIETSSVSFSTCSFIDTARPIYFSCSQISFVNILVDTVSEFCRTFEHVMDEDSRLMELVVEDNTVTLDNCEVLSSNILHTKDISRLSILRTKFTGCSLPFDISNCKNIEMSGITCSATASLMKMYSSSAKVEKSSFNNGYTSFELNNSRLDATKTTISNQKNGITVNSGIVRISNSAITDNDIGVALEGSGCVLEHFSCDFENNLVRPVLRKPGSEVIDIDEYEREA